MAAPTLPSPLITVLWGLFCACSWTWCIGMYLPRLMIDRFGWPGFIAFAVPNVLGCAAFGYMVRTKQRSEAMIQTRAAAMTWFSVITIAYHMFFIVFLFGDALPEFADVLWLPVATALIVFGLGLTLSFLPDRDWLVLTIITYGVSIIALAAIGLAPLTTIAWQGEEPSAHLAWITPTLVFGFLLCPYLDLTFHRALQRSPSRHAFAVFGVAFAMMLVLTCVMWYHSRGMLPVVALAHLLMQAIFTVGAHLREVRLSPAITSPGWRAAAIAGPLLALPLLYLARMINLDAQPGEAVYLRFLVFYGLVFPAFVWWMMMRSPVTPVRKAALVVLVLAALPLYELGYLHGRPWLLVLPLIALVIGDWALRRGTQGEPAGA